MLTGPLTGWKSQMLPPTQVGKKVKIPANTTSLGHSKGYTSELSCERAPGLVYIIPQLLSLLMESNKALGLSLPRVMLRNLLHFTHDSHRCHLDNLRCKICLHLSAVISISFQISMAAIPPRSLYQHSGAQMPSCQSLRCSCSSRINSVCFLFLCHCLIIWQKAL